MSLSGAWVSGDLGCSSEYSMENIEGRSGEGFRFFFIETKHNDRGLWGVNVPNTLVCCTLGELLL